MLYKTTTSDFSSGPPSNPSTGDIWIASNVDANGTRWQFQYNAGSASAYKWEFIGGPPAYIRVDTFENGTTVWGSTQDLATVGPSFTCTRDGDYAYMFTARCNHGTAGSAVVTMVKWGASFGSNDGGTATTTSSTASADEMAAEQGIATAVGAGNAIKMVYAVLTAGTGRWGQRRLWITPVRVS